MSGARLTITAIKGGTGKTTSAAALAQAARREGRRVLLVDMDPQADLSIITGADLGRPGSYDMITGRETPGSCVQTISAGMDIAAGSADLATLATGSGSARRLGRALDDLDGYDLTIIDSGPGMGEALNNALYAAGAVLIPLAPDAMSLQALYQSADMIGHVRQYNTDLRAAGVFVTCYDARAKIRRFMRDTIRDAAEGAGLRYLGEVRQGVAVQEAQAYRADLYEYAGRSRPAQDYADLFKHIVQELL